MIEGEEGVIGDGGGVIEGEEGVIGEGGVSNWA